MAKVRYGFFIDPDLLESLRDRSESTGESVGQLINNACQAYLSETEEIKIKQSFSSIEELLKELKTLHEGK